MSSLQLYRLSGLSLLIGAVVATISSVVMSLLFPDNSDIAAATNPLNVLLSLVGVVGTVLVLLGLPGMYARVARQGGLLWLIGVVLIALTAMLFGIFFGLMSVIVFPTLATRAPDLFREGPPPSFFPLFIIGTVANALGALLMGIAMLTRSIYARWCGYLMIVACVLAIVSFFVNGPSPSLVGQLVNAISPVPLFVVLGWAGYELWAGRSAVGELAAPGRRTATQAV